MSHPLAVPVPSPVTRDAVPRWRVPSSSELGFPQLRDSSARRLRCKSNRRKFAATLIPHYVGLRLDFIAMGDQQQQQQQQQEQPPGDATTSSHRSTPAATPHSSASSPFKKGMQRVELELRLLEAFAIYRPSLLVGMHRHFILFGLMDHLERRLNQRFSPDEVLQLLDQFFNLELLKPDDEELELVNHEEDFSLPTSIFEEIKDEVPA